MFTQPSQNSFHQQQINPQPVQVPLGIYGTNQQAVPYAQNPYGQPYPPDLFVANHQQPSNDVLPGPCYPLPQQNPHLVTPTGHTQMGPGGYLPQNVLDQIRTCVGNTAPIFILPNNCSAPASQHPPQLPTLPTYYPSAIAGYLPPGMIYPAAQPVAPVCYPPTIYPCPYPLPIYDPYGNPSRNKNKSDDCSCHYKKAFTSSTSCKNCSQASYCNSGKNHEDNEEHRCCEGNDDTVCTKKNCPSSINLQALASQLLALQGIISCTATRLVLRKVPGSNVTTSLEETIERAQKSINLLNKEQLLAEARSAQQVNALINLHITANPPANVIPILTLIQLKVNLLKAHVESLVNRKLMEIQGVGAENNMNLDPVLLAMKSDAELRDLLATLRQKECEERVNVNYAPYHSQRVIAESRLSNVQRKIDQLEAEMERRRSSAIPHSPMSRLVQEFSEPLCASYFNSYPNVYASGQNDSPQNYESPDPFLIQVRSPRRLNLRPCVGSPETTYNREDMKRNRETNEPQTSNDADENNADDCTCSKSCQESCAKGNHCGCRTNDNSDDEVKKKLRVNIDEKGRVRVVTNGDTGEGITMEAGILKLSPNVVVIVGNDRTGSEVIDEDNVSGVPVTNSERSKKNEREIKKKEESKGGKKSGWDKLSAWIKKVDSKSKVVEKEENKMMQASNFSLVDKKSRKNGSKMKIDSNGKMSLSLNENYSAEEDNSYDRRYEESKIARVIEEDLRERRVKEKEGNDLKSAANYTEGEKKTSNGMKKEASRKNENDESIVGKDTIENAERNPNQNIQMEGNNSYLCSDEEVGAMKILKERKSESAIKDGSAVRSYEGVKTVKIREEYVHESKDAGKEEQLETKHQNTEIYSTDVQFDKTPFEIFSHPFSEKNYDGVLMQEKLDSLSSCDSASANMEYKTVYQPQNNLSKISFPNSTHKYSSMKSSTIESTIDNKEEISSQKDLVAIQKFVETVEPEKEEVTPEEGKVKNYNETTKLLKLNNPQIIEPIENFRIQEKSRQQNHEIETHSNRYSISVKDRRNRRNDRHEERYFGERFDENRMTFEDNRAAEWIERKRLRNNSIEKHLQPSRGIPLNEKLPHQERFFREEMDREEIKDAKSIPRVYSAINSIFESFVVGISSLTRSTTTKSIGTNSENSNTAVSLQPLNESCNIHFHKNNKILMKRNGNSCNANARIAGSIFTKGTFVTLRILDQQKSSEDSKSNKAVTVDDQRVLQLFGSTEGPLQNKKDEEQRRYHKATMFIDSGGKRRAVRKIRHSVIRDFSSGRSYVLVDEPPANEAPGTSRLGSPRVISRNLVIRSHLKHPHRFQKERDRAFITIRSFKKREQHVASSSSPQQSREDSRKLLARSRNPKSTEKFCLLPIVEEEMGEDSKKDQRGKQEVDGVISGDEIGEKIMIDESSQEETWIHEYENGESDNELPFRWFYEGTKSGRVLQGRDKKLDGELKYLEEMSKPEDLTEASSQSERMLNSYDYEKSQYPEKNTKGAMQLSLNTEMVPCGYSYEPLAKELSRSLVNGKMSQKEDSSEERTIPRREKTKESEIEEAATEETHRVSNRGAEERSTSYFKRMAKNLHSYNAYVVEKCERMMKSRGSDYSTDSEEDKVETVMEEAINVFNQLIKLSNSKIS